MALFSSSSEGRPWRQEQTERGKGTRTVLERHVVWIRGAEGEVRKELVGSIGYGGRVVLIMLCAGDELDLGRKK